MRAAWAAMVGLMLGGCLTPRQTPEFLAACTDDALAQRSRTVAADVILVSNFGLLPTSVGDGAMEHDCGWSCPITLLKYHLRAVEFRHQGKIGRIFLAADGDPRCAGLEAVHMAPNKPLIPVFKGLAPPKGQCVAVEFAATPSARYELRHTTDPPGGTGERFELLEIATGAPLAVVRDHTRYAKSLRVRTCADSRKGFPRDPVDFIMQGVNRQGA
jgi:hypothetical protein